MSKTFEDRVADAFEKHRGRDAEDLLRAVGAADPEQHGHPLATWALHEAGTLMRHHAEYAVARGQREFDRREMRIFVSSVLLHGIIVGALMDKEDEPDAAEDDDGIEPGVMNKLVIQIATEEGDEMSHEEMTADLATFGLDFEQADGNKNELVQFAVDRADRILSEMAEGPVGVITQSALANSMGAQFLAGVTMGVKAVFAWLDGDNPA